MQNNVQKAQHVQNILISAATNDPYSFEDGDYEKCRKFFIEGFGIEKLPEVLGKNRDLKQFWQFIKNKFKHYSERREYIYEQFSPFLDYLEAGAPKSADDSISIALKDFDEEGIHTIWQKALKRRDEDPEGAITLARTLLESVCKHILDHSNVEYDESRIELPELYKLTSAQLNLSPHQHTEGIFRQILGGCSGIVGGLGQLRNKLSDAHGKGKKHYRPVSRHAQLAVNLSGSVALFLIETFNHSNKRGI